MNNAQPKPPPIRVAILECDPLTASVRAQHGSYGDVVSDWLRAGAQRANAHSRRLEFSKWNVQDYLEYPELDQIDAIVVTGSRFSAYDDIPWISSLVRFTRQALQHPHVRSTGLCFGHQIIGRALGAPGGVSDGGYEMSVCGVNLTPLGQRLFGKEDLAVHQLHHDAVSSYPKGASPLGSSPACPIQGMYCSGNYLTLQGHPEFDGDMMAQLLYSTDELGFEDKSLWEDAMRRVKEPHDGPIAAETFLRFICGDFDN